MRLRSIGRKLLTTFNRLVVPWTTGWSDRFFLHPEVPNIEVDYMEHASRFANKKGCRVLEIGSREVTGDSSARRLFANAEYVGFDYHPGPNVDVVGDAHSLGEYFDEPFDLIYSLAVFEHLSAPWIVAEEISKLLKPGGMVVIATHFSFAAHERPWNFFQFSDMGLKALFPEKLGFECIEASMSNPIIGRFSALAHKSVRFSPIIGLYCSSQFVGQKNIEPVYPFDWKSVSSTEICSGENYPVGDRAHDKVNSSLL